MKEYVKKLREKYIFEQDRVGLNGEEFTIYKFRTMKNGEVTKMGKFLRETHSDEFPQIINIFNGDMSFMGPRAVCKEDFDQLDSEVKEYRNQRKPSVAGIHYAEMDPRIGKMTIQQENDAEKKYILMKKEHSFLTDVHYGTIIFGKLTARLFFVGKEYIENKIGKDFTLEY